MSQLLRCETNSNCQIVQTVKTNFFFEILHLARNVLGFYTITLILNEVKNVIVLQ